MKLICECGNEMEFVGQGRTDENDSEWVKRDYSKFTVVAEHDICWITCDKCNKSIVFFT